MELTKNGFYLVFNEMYDSTRNYYYNKFIWSQKHSAIGLIFPSKQIYRAHMENGCIETLLDYNRKQGRHVDFSETWVRCDDRTDSLLQTADNSIYLMDPKLVAEMYDWIIADPDLLDEWLQLYERFKEER